MQAWLRLLVVAWLAIAGTLGCARENVAVDWVNVAELPVEARATLALIKQGGPFPYDRDGIVFGNFEKRLPLRPRGHYREYTVKSPGRRDRGPRRIVAGSSGEFYYTADHYDTFRRIRE
jgi:ribonuclease T1